ncbi:hypothetical protein [Nocardioides dongxiaopingii]|nr:hypothetical protein [Nocardioides dongxiaopingii]
METGFVDREWMRGYQDGRSLCLKHGVEAELPTVPAVSPAYESGFSWAVFDWADANGLPQTDRSHRGA